MKKKGFTLAELLGVVVILGLITILAFPPLVKKISESKNKLNEATDAFIATSLDNYLTDNKDKYPKSEAATYCITLNELNENNYLPNNLKDANGKDIDLSTIMEVTFKDNQLNYQYVDTCIPVLLGNPYLKSEDNCISSTDMCTKGTKVNVQVNDKENYDFYVIADDGHKLTLIMNKNIGENVEWISKEDYLEANKDGTPCVHSTSSYDACTDEGPLTALKYLKEQTDGWTNVSNMNYTLIDDSATIPLYAPISITNVKARMLTYTEAMSLNAESTNLDNCPNWVSESSHDSYWFSTGSDLNVEATNISPSSAYVFSYQDNANCANITTTIVYMSYGVRPVIEMSKTL